MAAIGYMWDGASFVKMLGDSVNGLKVNVVATVGGGGGGGPATIADGADVAQGTTTDLSSANTVVGTLKAIKAAITGTVATSLASQPLPTGASTGALQTTGNASLASIDTKLTNPLPVSWAAAQHVIVDSGSLGSVTINGVPHVIIDSATLGTVAVSLASLPSLAAGTAVIGHVIVDSGSVSVSNLPALGQAVSASSLPVALSSDDANLTSMRRSLNEISFYKMMESETSCLM